MSIAPRSDRRVTLVDTTLRDGMSSVSHQFTTDDVAAVAAGLDRAGVSTIEVAHEAAEWGADLVTSLREAGAQELYFISSAPPIIAPCIYGIDMAMSTDLIAANYTEEEICRYIEADKVIYQSIEDLQELFADDKGHGGSCFACFSGKYPTGDVTHYLRHIQEERASHRVDKKEKKSVSAKAPAPTEH